MEEHIEQREQIVKHAQFARPRSLRVMFLYVVQAGPYCKVGVSINMANRMATYATHCPLEASCVALYEVDNTFCLPLEREVHRLLKPHHTKGEWFVVTPAEAMATIEAAANNGVTLSNGVRAYPIIRPVRLGPTAQKAAHPRKVA